MSSTGSMQSLNTLARLGDDLDDMSGAFGDVLTIGAGISGSIDLALAISDLPDAFA